MPVSTSQLDLHLESLERRLHLAGNVTVVQNAAGNVIVTGDAADNEITFEVIEDSGVYVQGVVGTTLNSQAGPILLSDTDVLDGNLTIRTRGGGDYVSLEQLTITGTTRIETAGGEDVLVSSGANFLGELRIRTGGALDQITFDHGNATAQVDINTGAGNDVTSVDGAQWSQGMLFNGTGGDDYLLVSDSSVQVLTDIRGGGGNDYVELQSFTSDGGDNQGIRVSLNSGDDHFRLNEFSYLDGDLTVNTAGGDDLISIRTLGMHGDVNLITGAGSDLVAIVNTTTIDALDVNLGGGNDGLLFGCSRATDSNIRSGGGADLLLLGGEMETLSLTTAGGEDTVVLNRIEVEDSMSINMGGQNDQLYSSMSVFPFPAVGELNGGAGQDTAQSDDTGGWVLPLISFEDALDPQPMDDIVLGGIFVFGTAWTENGGLASDLVC